MSQPLHTSLLGRILTDGKLQAEVVAIWQDKTQVAQLHALMQVVQTGQFISISLPSGEWRSLRST